MSTVMVKRAPQFVQADPNLVELVAEQFARMDGRQFFSLRHDSPPSSVVIHDFGAATSRFGGALADLESCGPWRSIRPRAGELLS